MKRVTAEEFKQETGFGVETLIDLKAIQNRIRPRLVKGDDLEYLAGKPHKWVDDLAVTYFVYIGEHEGGQMSAPVTHNILSAWGIDLDELHRIAVENLNPVVMPMGEVLAEMGVPCLECDPPMLVMTNNERFFGAGEVLCEKTLRACAEKFGDDVAIIPSSVHEVLLIPAGSIAAKELAEIIRGANETQVAPNERLSDKAYIYSPDTGIKAA